MCTSETTICYGVVIRSWQLIVAAHAFIKFSPLLRGIDTVIFRQRNGTLRVEGEDVGGGKNVGDLPVEVLELIRSQAFDEKELIRAAKKLVEGKCRGSADWRTIPRPRDNSSDQFWDAHWDAITDVQFYGDNQRERVDKLLGYYGLSLPSEEMGIATESGCQDIEDSSTSVIALPSSITKLTVETNHEGLARANGMILPPRPNGLDSAPNFRRFFRDFQFDVVTDFGAPPPTTPATAAKESSGDGAKSGDSQKVDTVKPDWILWTSSETCD